MSNDCQILPYDENHLACMELREHEAKTIGKEYLKHVASASTCKTIFIRANPIAVIGFYYMWSGVVNIFVIPSKHIQKHARDFLCAVVTELDALWHGELNLHRMETKSRADDSTDRWMQWLGFNCEGTMVGYSQDKDDYRIWARTRTDGSD